MVFSAHSVNFLLFSSNLKLLSANFTFLFSNQPMCCKEKSIYCKQRINPFPNDKFQTLPNCESLLVTISNLMKGQEVLPMIRTHWEKEKLLVTSNFSFSISVFKKLVLQTHKNHGLFGNGLGKCSVYVQITFTKQEELKGIV